MMKNSLNVYFKDRVVGILSLDEESQNFNFEYSDSWKKDGFIISPHIRFDSTASSATIKKFLDNLLPEGKALEVFSLFFHVSKNNTLALTREIGNETSGALSFFDDEIKQMKTSIRPIDRRELTNRILVEDPIQLIIWDGKPRLSVAGVQDKLPVMYDGKEYSFGEGRLASTHILKFDTDRQRYIVLNEFICMRLAKEVGLDVAEVSLERFDKKAALLVERFDRIRLGDDEVKRVHVIDGCQALNLAPTYKYERNMGSSKSVKDIRDGVSFKKLFEFAKECKNPIKTKLHILRWAFFNLIISNSDAHGKNISFFVDKKGFELTPFYDMVSIAMYPEFEQELSMAFGDQFCVDVKAYDIASMCKESDINIRLASRELKNLSILVKKGVENIDKLEFTTNHNESKFVSRLLDTISDRASKYKYIADELLNVVI